ncbi:MAG: hypothetical protein KGS61_18105 [Verrucomicrobia bacterium]|nr:hypothetical protein [Verrucomicrobiota bacterium]
MVALGWQLAATACWAQVTVQVTLEQQEFMPSESLVAIVRITNFSGQKLQLGLTPDWLRFNIANHDGSIVTKLGDAPVLGGFTLDTSEVATKRVEVAPYFDLSTPGEYDLSAVVRIPQWSQDFTSPPRRFSIIRGTRLAEQQFGVPDSATGPDGRPEMRKYILSEASYLTHPRLYVRVTDLPETRVFSVTSIAPMVSFSHPEFQLDRAGNLHVLHQTGARAFSYCVINPAGQIVMRQIYEYTKTRPVLRAAADGKIVVRGGARRPTRADIPPPAPRTNAVAPAQP